MTTNAAPQSPDQPVQPYYRIDQGVIYCQVKPGEIEPLPNGIGICYNTMGDVICHGDPEFLAASVVAEIEEELDEDDMPVSFEETGYQIVVIGPNVSADFVDLINRRIDEEGGITDLLIHMRPLDATLQ